MRVEPARQSSRIMNATKNVVEPLEIRRLLATISWVNKGTGAGVGDLDDFNAIYGTNANLARSIVQRAIDDWEAVIANFNGSGGRNTFNLTLSATAFSGGLRGSTGSISYDALNKPQSATIQLDDNGGGSGWYFDPTPGSSAVPDDSEFTTLVTPFDADAPGVTGFDFYRTTLHEIGHAMGLASSAPRITSVEVDIGDDPNSGDPADRLVRVTTGGQNYTLTTNGGRHFFEGNHPNELMNAGRAVPAGTRRLVSDFNAIFLRDLYNYTITLPSTINTFAVNLNTTTNVVTVSGDIDFGGDDTDIIDLEVTGSSMRFEVNEFSEVIAGAQFSTINVNAGVAADDVDVDQLLSGKTVTIDLGSGDDRLDVAAEFQDIDTNLLSNVSVNAGSGTDTLTFYDANDGNTTNVFEIAATRVRKDPTGVDVTVNHSNAEQIVVNGSAFADTFNVVGIASGDVVTINGGDGNDTFNVGGDDFDSNIAGDIQVNGDAGTDRLDIEDSADTGIDTYTINATSATKPNGSGAVSFGGTLIGTVTIDALVLNASDANSTINFNASGGSILTLPPNPPIITPVNVTLNGGDGNDTINVAGPSNLLTAIRGNTVLTGGAGTDLIVINDSADSTADAFTIAGSTLTVSDWDYTASLSADGYILNAGTGNDTINTTAGGAWTYNGGAGADEFEVQSGINHVVHGQGGLDSIRVNQDETSIARVNIDQDEDLALLHLFEGGALTFATGGDLVIDTQNMGTVRGTVDLKDNMIVVRSPTVPFLLDKIVRGYNGGAWNGVPAGGASGVILSTVAGSTARNDAIGYARIGAGIGELNAAVVGGVPVTAGSLVMRYTIAGDTNLDQTVNFDDLLSLAQAYGGAGNWVQGDSNYSQSVNFDDLLVLAQNYGTSALIRPSPTDSILRGSRDGKMDLT